MKNFSKNNFKESSDPTEDKILEVFRPLAKAILEEAFNFVDLNDENVSPIDLALTAAKDFVEEETNEVEFDNIVSTTATFMEMNESFRGRKFRNLKETNSFKENLRLLQSLLSGVLEDEGDDYDPSYDIETKIKSTISIIRWMINQPLEEITPSIINSIDTKVKTIVFSLISDGFDEMADGIENTWNSVKNI